MNRKEYEKQVSKNLDRAGLKYIEMARKQFNIKGDVFPKEIKNIIKQKEQFLVVLMEALTRKTLINDTNSYKGLSRIAQFEPKYREMLANKMGKDLSSENFYPEKWESIIRYEKKADCLIQAIREECLVEQTDLYNKLVEERELEIEYAEMIHKKIGTNVAEATNEWMDFYNCEDRIRIYKEAIENECLIKQTDLYKEQIEKMKLYREHKCNEKDKGDER